MYFEDNKNYESILGMLEQKYGTEIKNEICDMAERIYWEIRKEHSDLSKAKRGHTDDRIFPRIAMYQAMQQKIDKKEAMKIIETGIWESAAKTGEKYRKMTKKRFMRPIFLAVFNAGTKNMFGEAAGFREKFYPKKKGEVRFDIEECPYCHYCKEYGCEELTHTFCKSDEYLYGNLTGIQFERTQTLGTGGTCCDFYLYRT